MSTAVLTTIKAIKLRKDTEANYSKIASAFIPQDGEVCLVATTSSGLRAKVGDGKTSFASLPYNDEDNSFKAPVVLGYYRENAFYSDAAFATAVNLYAHQLYVDKTSHNLYYYDGTNLICTTADIPNATSTTAGLVKLYNTKGNNADGTVTQQFFTSSIEGITFSIDADDDECLVLNKPW